MDDANGRQFARSFAVAFGILALFLHPGVYINDELAQALGLHFLGTGELLVDGDDIPSGYQPIFEEHFRHWSIPRPGQAPMPPAASPMLSLLALPVLAVLELLGAIATTRAALAIAGAVAVGWGAWSGFRWAGRPVPKWLFPALAAGYLPTLWGPKLPASPYLEFAALHMVSMAAIALATALLVDILASRFGLRTALITGALFLVGTPAMFWGLNAKYHALAIGLVAAAFWTYQDGSKTRPARTFLTYAIVGLALFNYLPIGGFLALTVGLVSLGAVRLGFVEAGKRAGAAIAGLAVGLAPEVLYRWAVAQKTTVQYIVGVGQGPESDAGLLAQLFTESRVLLKYSIPADAPAGLFSLLRALAWTRWQDGPTLAFAALAPWAIVGALALPFLPAVRRRLGGPLVALALLHISIVFFFLGTALLGTPGYDPRYAATAWPALALLGAPLVHRLDHHLPVATVVRPTGLLVLALFWLALVLNMVIHALGMSLTPQLATFDELLIVRLTGTVCAVGLAGALLVRPGTAPTWFAIGAWNSIAVQVLLQLTFANHAGQAPFAMWPLDLAARLVHWMFTGTYTG